MTPTPQQEQEIERAFQVYWKDPGIPDSRKSFIAGAVSQLARVEALEKEVAQMTASRNEQADIGHGLLAELNAGDIKRDARITALSAQVVALRETLVAIRAINVNEFGYEGDAAINRLVDSVPAAADYQSKCVVEADRLNELEADRRRLDLIESKFAYAHPRSERGRLLRWDDQMFPTTLRREIDAIDFEPDAAMAAKEGKA